MRSPTVWLEVLPVANKQRYEKSLIGQLFSPEGQDAVGKGRPVPLKPDARHARTPDPATWPAELQASPASEVMTPGPPSSKGSSSSSSPLPKSPGLAPVVPPSGKKAGKKLRIDLKKGKCSSATLVMPLMVTCFCLQFAGRP